jgi:hypothetical protein
MPPDWAVAKVSAALQAGLRVPEIEQLLIAKGVSPANAAAIVTNVIEGRVRDTRTHSEQGERQVLVHRVASALVGCVCLLLAYWFGEGLSAGRTLLSILLPLACIWFPDFMEHTVPPPVLRSAAWLLLLVIAGYRVFLLTV